MIEINKGFAKMPTEKLVKKLGGTLMSKEEEQEIAAFLKKNRFTEKYRKSLRSLAWMGVERCRKQHPEWGLTEVLSDIFKRAHRDMPPDFLLELMQHVLAEWERTAPVVKSEVQKEEYLEPALA